MLPVASAWPLADRLLDRGLAVVLADIQPAALRAADARLQGPGRRLLSVHADVADADSVQELAATTLRTFGAVHLVCNNAGVTGAGGPTWSLDHRDWQWALGVNLWGVINGIRAFTPTLIEQDRGHVLNTASLAGLTSAPYTAPYNASKHAVVAITETLANELAMRGSAVKTSVACPGFVATNIWEAERNRPADLEHTPADVDPGYEAFADVIAQMATGAQQPDDTAARMLDGVERDELHVLTHPDMNQLVRDRIAVLQVAIS